MTRWFISLLILVLLAFIGFVTHVLLLQPKTDTTWDPEFARVTTASTTPSGAVMLYNVRDFTYSGAKQIQNDAWIESREINPKDITRVWFLIDHFSSWDGIAHTFLSFELKDGSAITLSIEARREAGESYAAIDGLLNTYEL